MSFTSEEPATLIEQHGFDPNLYVRLSQLIVVLPALREFAEDVPDIAVVMLARLVETRVCQPRHFSIAALNRLRNFGWPGNLEELSSAVRNLALTSLEEMIDVTDVERVLSNYSPRPRSPGVSLDQPLRQAREAFERAYFEHHLAMEDGSIARVAEKCGLERTHLYRKLKTLGIAAGRKEE